MTFIVIITPKIPVKTLRENTAQNDRSAASGTNAVVRALIPKLYATTVRPPSHSASTPPGKDVSKYPQKYEPKSKLCSPVDQLYRGPY